MYFIRPDLVDQQAIKSQSGIDQGRLNQLKFGYTGIWWYARYPNHYASGVVRPDKRLGELLIQSWVGQMAELVKYLKTNNAIEQLQEEFYRKTEDPL